MRQARLKASTEQPVAYYHCISRVVERRFLLADQDKEQFVAYMRLYEQFCGLRVVTFCVLSNHFHILVEVPRRPAVLPSDEELLAKLGKLYSRGHVREVRERLKTLPEDEAQAMRESYFGRMWDISLFMKTLKQRFSQWYNHQHGRKGTLWEERYKSVLVDSAGAALATMAAYIDLNPVRAGLVGDPKDYRWCGYAEAVAGKRASRLAYPVVIAAVEGQAVGVGKAMEAYRVWLYGQGAVEGVNAPGERTVRCGMDLERVKAVVEQKGRLPLPEYVRCRVRYFVDGAVLGSKAFVNGVFAANRRRFGAKRKDGARRLRYLEDTSLFALRDLRINPVG
jgi:putative transposase